MLLKTAKSHESVRTRRAPLKQRRASCEDVKTEQRRRDTPLTVPPRSWRHTPSPFDPCSPDPPVPVVIYGSFIASMDTVSWLYSLPETTSHSLHIFKAPPRTCRGAQTVHSGTGSGSHMCVRHVMLMSFAQKSRDPPNLCEALCF